MNGEEYQSSQDANLDTDKDINESTSALLQQEAPECLKEGAFTQTYQQDSMEKLIGNQKNK